MKDAVTSKAAPQKEAKSEDDEDMESEADDGVESKSDDEDDDGDESTDDDADEEDDDGGKKKKGKESRSWFKFVTSKADGIASAAPEILVYDEIGGWGVSAVDFQRELKALGDQQEITMRINSPGGDSFQGIAIHNMLAAHPAKITAYVDGIAASAASLILMAADRRIAPKNTFLVIHNPSAMTMGDAKTHRAMADDLDRVTGSYAQTYSDRSYQDLAAAKSLMDEDRLLSAEEAEKLGYIDECTDSKMMAATFALDKIPERFKAAASIFKEPEMKKEPKAKAKLEIAVKAAVPEVAKEEPKFDYGQAEIDSTLELCTIANAPVAMATKFIGAKTPVDDVRKALLAHRASKNADTIISDVTLDTEKHERDPRMADEAIVANKRKIQEALKKEMGIRPRS